MAPKVSVIVSAYNVEPYIGACLESLARQTLQDIEVLVIDDGSTDGTRAVVEGFVDRDPDRFRLFQTSSNCGPSDARNLGLEHARGEYIGFVDSDDTAKRPMFEELYNRAEETGADIVVCGYTTVDASTGERVYRRQGWAKDYGKSLSERPQYLRSVAAYVWNKLWRRSLFEESGVRFPSGKLFEDIPVTYGLMAKANKIEKVQRSLYNYTRYRSGAITHSYSPHNLQMFESLALLNDFYKENGLFEEFEHELLLLSFRHAFNRFVELPRYSGFSIKQKLVTRAWQHLDEYFPGWREDADIARIHGWQWRLRYFMHKPLLHVYAATPRWVHVTRDSVWRANRSVKSFVKRFGPERRRLLRYARYVRRLPVNPRVALFESFHGKDITDAPFYLMRDLGSRGGHEIFVSAVNVEEAREYLARYGIDATPIAPGTETYRRLLATAGILVNNVSFPPYFVKRPEQVYLNTWHGTPLKTLGKSMPYGLKDLPNLQRNFLKSDYVLFTNEFTKEHVERDYMIGDSPGHLLMGSPRNEALLDGVRADELRKELGLAGKRIFVYMPTWRGGNSRSAQGVSFSEEVSDFLSTLDGALTDGDVLLVKLHHLVAADVDLEELLHVEHAPRGCETYNLLSIADTLITDYSSVLFDFAVTGREILLFPYDKEEYLAERSLYLDYDQLPFREFGSADELSDHISRQETFEAGPEYLSFVRRFAPLDKPGATAALSDVLLAGNSHVSAQADEVDVVFLPYLKKRGQKKLEKLLAEEYHGRSDVVFVFSIKQFYAQANAYLFRLYKEECRDVRYVVSTGRMLATVPQAIALRLNRSLGLFQRHVDEMYLLETKRLFGNLRIRSARDVSGYRKYAELAGAINGAAQARQAERLEAVEA